MPTAEILGPDTCERIPKGPIEVLVIAGKPVVVYPNHLRVAFGYKGTIVWMLAGDSDMVFFDPGIRFNEETSFSDAKLINPRRCEVTADNTFGTETGVRLAYTLLFWHDGEVVSFDPTVENDPPGHSTPGRK